MKTTLSFSLSLLALITISVFSISCESEPPASPDSDGEANATSTETAAATRIDHVDAAGAAKLLASDSAPVVLDVRTPAEFSEGHIEGAKMIDFTAADFESKVAELDRDQAYLVHCQSGGRSTNSLEVFEELGFKHIIHLDGGMNSWESSGNPVAK